MSAITAMIAFAICKSRVSVSLLWEFKVRLEMLSLELEFSIRAAQTISFTQHWEDRLLLWAPLQAYITYNSRATCNSKQKLWMSSCPESSITLHVPSCQRLFRALLRWNRSLATPQMLLWLDLIEVLSCLSWCDTAALLQIHKRNIANVNILKWAFITFWPPVFSLCFLLPSKELLI